MILEDSSGNSFQPKSSEEIEKVITLVGNDIDHCILSDGDSFIQTAATREGLLVEYHDAGRYYQSTDTNLPADTVQRLFTKFFEGDISWKQEIPFTLQNASSSAASPATGAANSTGGKVTEFEARSLKDTVMNSVKNEAQNSLSYFIRRIVRRFFRRIF